MTLQDYLIKCAHSLGAELKEADPGAEERGQTFAALTRDKLYCPECWVRYGSATTLHQKRWLMSCDEHDYQVPPVDGQAH